MTLKEACNYLGITTAAMYAYTHKRAFPYYRPTGRRVYFMRADLDNWIKSNRVASNEEIEEASR